MTARLNRTQSLGSLQAEYRRAWHQYTVMVEELQSVLNRVPREDASLAEARHRVDTAVAAYRGARNALACALLADSGEELSPLDCSQPAAA